MEEATREAQAAEAADRAFFRSIQWTAKLMDDPDFAYIPMISRIPKASTEDSFFAETVKTDTTIPHLLSLYRKPASGERINEVRVLMHLGDKLNGWAHVVHGGMQSFIMDEAMVLLLGSSKRVPEARALGTNTVTAEMKVRFVKTMRSPAVVCVTARLKDVKGRKCFAEASVTDEHGNVLASAEALFLMVNPTHGQKL
jgi:acyl-coenzyme A thioesterase PaaI-like protein